MRLVVADTGPLNYLVLTGYIELLPELFERVLAPQAVRDELADPEAPAPVRAWIAQTPAWLEVRPTPDARLDELANPKRWMKANWQQLRWLSRSKPISY
jgi:predicted nucleic acid-binding protein